MPYRPVTVSAAGGPETFWVRIADDAVADWLAERSHLRECGYPDRPPDVDTSSLRVWVPRPGEHATRQFGDRAGRFRLAADPTGFPVYAVSWRHGDVMASSVLATGFPDGSILSRVTIDGPAGESRVDKARLHGPEEDPAAVWEEVETIVAFIDCYSGWDPGDPQVIDYCDFVALDTEVAAAEAEARAAGLLADRRRDC
jgi:hypothetical protein